MCLDYIKNSGITVDEYKILRNQVPAGLGVQDNPDIPDDEDLTKG